MVDKSKRNIQERLKSIVETLDIANVLTSPISESVINLLTISSAAIQSEGVSVLIRDESSGGLEFKWAIGRVAEMLIGMKIPAGKGIAGFVYSSGQPMAVSDTGQESVFYAAVDRDTGFTTQSILATPLQYQGSVIGVLEYVNREGAPPFKPFTSDEMDLAAIYADAIASLVHAHETANVFSALSDKVLANQEEKDLGEIRAWLSDIKDSHGHREMLGLAMLVRELASKGDAERRICREVLESVVRYSEQNSELDYTEL